MAHVTIQDVARAAHVSLGTVSNAINHPGKLRPETLARVRDAMAELGFLPNQSARMLAGGRNASFGLVLPRLDHGFSLQIANGAHSEARRHGYGLLVANADEDLDLEQDYLRYFMGTQMSGILVQPLTGKDWSPRAGVLPIPVVYLDTHSDLPGYFVAADNVAQGRLIAEHAISLRARRIAVVGQAEDPALERRIEGVREVARKYPDVDFQHLDEGAWNLARDGYMIGSRLAADPEDTRPDFVLALTDVLATGVIAGIQDAGLAVPDDIAVAGCDGNPLAWSGGVPLTTCAPAGYEIGRRGVQFLIEQIEQQKEARAAAERDAEAAVATTSRESTEDPCHRSLVRPFLLARQSTVRTSGGTKPAAQPGLDLGTYL